MCNRICISLQKYENKMKKKRERNKMSFIQTDKDIKRYVGVRRMITYDVVKGEGWKTAKS